ncbi:MAG: DNA polymerase III subunit delta [Eggerthellaceae bacterium]|nr:DNA polymerase III subunit delta [Eggerthellaceae bacterium]
MVTLEKDDALLPAYLVNGEDLLKRQAVLARLKARVGGGDAPFNYDLFSGEGASAEAVVAACNTLPFASDLRLVQVNEADSLKKADSEALVEYLKDPSPTAVLALVADKLAANTRLYKAVSSFGAKAVISCLPQKRYELVKTVRSLAQGHRMSITEGGAQALIDLVGESTVALDSEVRKLALAHVGAEPITEQEVRFLVSRTAEAKPWEFVDAFSARDIRGSMACLSRMGASSAYTLLPQCVRRLRGLICARALYERGQAGGVASALKMPEWQVKNFVRWSLGFSKEELRHALTGARDVERAMKSGADAEAAFLEWALGCMRWH